MWSSLRALRIGSRARTPYFYNSLTPKQSIKEKKSILAKKRYFCDIWTHTYLVSYRPIDFIYSLSLSDYSTNFLGDPVDYPVGLLDSPVDYHVCFLDSHVDYPSDFLDSPVDYPVGFRVYLIADP